MIIFLIFMSFLCANGWQHESQFSPVEECSFENDDLWIKIINLCKKDEMICNKVIFIELNKNNGEILTMQGTSNGLQMAKSYNFLKNNYEYEIYGNNVLYIFKNHEMLKEIKLKKCAKK